MAHRALLAVLAFGAVEETRASGRHKGGGWRMAHHSFTKTLTYDDHLGDWLASAGTMALRDRVQLLPPVANRFGLLWSKQAVNTRDFSVTFTLSGNPSIQEGPKDAAVAFWISPDNFAVNYHENAIVKASKNWAANLQSVGLSLLSNKPTFSGLAMVFAAAGTTGAGDPRQSVSGVWNDGSQAMTMQSLVQGPGAQMKHVDWLGISTQARIRVSPDGSIVGSVNTMDIGQHLNNTVWKWMEDGLTAKWHITFVEGGSVRVDGGAPEGSWKVIPGNRLRFSAGGHTAVVRFEGSHRALQEEPLAAVPAVMEFDDTAPDAAGSKASPDRVAPHWIEVFKMPAGTLPVTAKECFIGFSGWTGSETHIEANLHELEMTNFDSSTAGEQDKDILQADEGKWKEMLEMEKRFSSQENQAEAVKHISDMLKKHVESYDSQGETLKQELVKLESRMSNTETEIASLLSAAQAWNLKKQAFEPQVVKDHIKGIRTVLTKGKAKHDATLQAVNQAASELKAKHGSSQLNEEGKAKVQSVADQTRAVEDLSARGSMQTNSLLLVMVVAVAGLGLLFLNRMRYYEKKHYI